MQSVGKTDVVGKEIDSIDTARQTKAHFLKALSAISCLVKFVLSSDCKARFAIPEKDVNNARPGRELYALASEQVILGSGTTSDEQHYDQNYPQLLGGHVSLSDIW